MSVAYHTEKRIQFVILNLMKNRTPKYSAKGRNFWKTEEFNLRIFSGTEPVTALRSFALAGASRAR